MSFIIGVLNSIRKKPRVSTSDAADAGFHLGGDTPFYADNTESQAIWINSL